MLPKKDLRALLMDLRVHVQWITENLQTLRSRAGVGLRGKLRQGDSPKERKIYDWFQRHERNVELSSLLSATVRALDAQVEQSSEASLSCLEPS